MVQFQLLRVYRNTFKLVFFKVNKTYQQLNRLYLSDTDMMLQFYKVLQIFVKFPSQLHIRSLMGSLFLPFISTIRCYSFQFSNFRRAGIIVADVTRTRRGTPALGSVIVCIRRISESY